MAAGVPQGGRVNDSITTLHEIYFYIWEYFMFTYDAQYQLRFMDTAIFDDAIYRLITHDHFSNILPSIMASLPVKIGTLLFALNLSNYLLPDVIGLVWRLCLAQHSMARG